MAFKLRSPAFGPGGEIPLKYTSDGADISPPLRRKWRTRGLIRRCASTRLVRRRFYTHGGAEMSTAATRPHIGGPPPGRIV
jgi:hypothetical protein